MLLWQFIGYSIFTSSCFDTLFVKCVKDYRNCNWGTNEVTSLPNNTHILLEIRFRKNLAKLKGSAVRIKGNKKPKLNRA